MCYLAIYATLQKHSNQPRGIQPIQSRGTRLCHSTARTNAYFSKWVIFNRHVGYGSVSSADGCLFPWYKFWPQFVQHFQIP